MEVLREASAKAELLNHGEVHPLHLLWAATSRTGLEALRYGKSDQQQAKLCFQLEKDFSQLPVKSLTNDEKWDDYPALGLKMQRLLLRAADYSTHGTTNDSRGRVGMTELVRALLQDDHRTASVLRTREEYLPASA